MLFLVVIVIMFSKCLSNLYQGKAKMNGIFTKKLFANVNSELAFSCKDLKTFKSGTKNIVFGYFGQTIKIEFAKAIVIYQLNILKFIKVQDFKHKKFLWDLELKQFILSCNFEKLLSYSESAHSTFSKCKGSSKVKKTFKIVIKNALFGYLWARVWKKYLTPATSNFSNK